MSKRVLGVLAVLAVLFLFAAACGDDSGGGDASGADGSAGGDASRSSFCGLLDSVLASLVFDQPASVTFDQLVGAAPAEIEDDVAVLFIAVFEAVEAGSPSAEIATDPEVADALETVGSYRAGEC